MPQTVGVLSGASLPSSPRSRAPLRPRAASARRMLAAHVAPAQGALPRVACAPEPGTKPLALRKLDSRPLAPGETPARAFLKALDMALRLKVRPDDCKAQLAAFGLESLFAEASAMYPGLALPRPEARSEDALLAALRSHSSVEEIRLMLDQASLEESPPAEREASLSVSEISAGVFRLELLTRDAGSVAWSATEAVLHLAARAALRDVLEREYPGIPDPVYDNWVHEAADLSFWQVHLILAAVAAVHDWGRPETPERVFLEGLADCLRLCADLADCAPLVRKFNACRDKPFSSQALVRESLTGRSSQRPWMLELLGEAREMFGELSLAGPDFRPDRFEEEEALLAAIRRHVAVAELSLRAGLSIERARSATLSIARAGSACRPQQGPAQARRWPQAAGILTRALSAFCKSPRSQGARLSAGHSNLRKAIIMLRAVAGAIDRCYPTSSGETPDASRQTEPQAGLAGQAMAFLLAAWRRSMCEEGA